MNRPVIPGLRIASRPSHTSQKFKPKIKHLTGGGDLGPHKGKNIESKILHRLLHIAMGRLVLPPAPSGITTRPQAFSQTTNHLCLNDYGEVNNKERKSEGFGWRVRSGGNVIECGPASPILDGCS